MLLSRRSWLATMLATLVGVVTRTSRAQAKPAGTIRQVRQVRKTRWIGHY
jgi:hypothetical protein